MILRMVCAICKQNAKNDLTRNAVVYLGIINKKYILYYTVLPKFQKPLYKKSILYYNVVSEKLRYAWRNFSERIYRSYNKTEKRRYPFKMLSLLHGSSKAKRTDSSVICYVVRNVNRTYCRRQYRTGGTK